MNENSQSLEQYLYRILKLQKGLPAKLIEQDLINACEQQGISWGELCEIADNHHQQAKGYLSIDHLTEALVQVEKAIQLHPLRSEFLCTKGSILLRQYDLVRKYKTLQEAEICFKKALSLDPNASEPLSLLKEASQLRKKKRRIRFFKRIVFCVLLIPILGLGIAVLYDIGLFDPSPTGWEGKEYKVPVEWVHETKGVGITLGTSIIKHGDYSYNGDEFRYSFSGLLRSDSVEVHSLRSRAYFLAANGDTIDSEIFWLVNDYNFIVRPSDEIVLEERESWRSSFPDRNVERITKVLLVEDKIEYYTAGAKYAVEDSIHVEWRAQRISGQDITFFTRKLEADVLHKSDSSSYMKWTMKFVNTGTFPIRRLVIQLKYKVNGLWIDGRKYSPIALEHKPLGVNDARLFLVDEHFYPATFSYPVPFEEVKVEVVSVE